MILIVKPTVSIRSKCKYLMKTTNFLPLGVHGDCEAYEKIVRNIPAGDNRKCEAYAKDIAGYTLYSQKKAVHKNFYPIK